MHAAAIYKDTQAAVNNSHFGEVAQTSRSLSLYMPTPAIKSKHDMSQIPKMSDMSQNVCQIEQQRKGVHHKPTSYEPHL